MIFFRPDFFPKTPYFGGRGGGKGKGEGKGKGGEEEEVEVREGEQTFGPWVVRVGWVEEGEMEKGVPVVREKRWVGGEQGKKRKRGNEEKEEEKGKEKEEKEEDTGKEKEEKEEKKEKRAGLGVMEVISGKIRYYLPSANRFVLFPRGLKGSGVVINPTIRDRVPFVVGRGKGEEGDKRFLEVGFFFCCVLCVLYVLYVLPVLCVLYVLYALCVVCVVCM